MCIISRICCLTLDSFGASGIRFESTMWKICMLPLLVEYNDDFIKEWSEISITQLLYEALWYCCICAMLFDYFLTPSCAGSLTRRKTDVILTTRQSMANEYCHARNNSAGGVKIKTGSVMKKLAGCFCLTHSLSRRRLSKLLQHSLDEHVFFFLTGWTNALKPALIEELRSSEPRRPRRFAVPFGQAVM